MEYSKEQIDKVQELAEVFLPISDIAVILEVDPNLLKADIRDYDNPVRAAYLKGKSLSKAALLSQEMKLAKIGSPLGLDFTRKALVSMEIDE